MFERSVYFNSRKFTESDVDSIVLDLIDKYNVRQMIEYPMLETYFTDDECYFKNFDASVASKDPQRYALLVMINLKLSTILKDVKNDLNLRRKRLKEERSKLYNLIERLDVDIHEDIDYDIFTFKYLEVSKKIDQLVNVLDEMKTYYSIYDQTLRDEMMGESVNFDLSEYLNRL